MRNLGIRKLQFIGGSHFVSLPAEFIQQIEAKTGDTVSLTQTAKNEILIKIENERQNF